MEEGIPFVAQAWEEAEVVMKTRTEAEAPSSERLGWMTGLEEATPPVIAVTAVTVAVVQ